MTITKCSNCDCEINTDIIFIRCCDAYVCSRICAQERYQYIKLADPHMCYSHAWQFKRLKKNQYGDSPIHNKKIIHSELNKPPESKEINHTITDIQFTYDSDNEVDNQIEEKQGKFIMSWVGYCAVNIMNIIISR